MSETQAFRAEIVTRVNARLEAYFAEKREEAEAISPDGPELVDAIRDLTLRGGKRLRAVAMAAAYRSVLPEGDLSAVVDEAAAIEILQSYLLIHDDWMDGDEERRGGPAAHVALAQRRGDAHLGASLGILAGDLGATYAWELHLAAPFPEGRLGEAHRRFIQLQKEVYFGQQLDIVAHPNVALMHQLKTGSYTVVGPLVLGALLAGANNETLDGLRDFGLPLGEAFQLRDDLLGTFGDPKHTGKPAGNDLRVGKQNAVVEKAQRLLTEDVRKPLTEVWGKSDASDESMAAAIELLVSHGIRKAVEDDIDAKVATAVDALASRLAHVADVEPLKTVASLLTQRSF